MPPSRKFLPTISFVLACALGGVSVAGADVHQQNLVWPPSASVVKKAAPSASPRSDSGKCSPCEALHAEKVVERWAGRHFPDSFAGMYVKSGRIDRLYIGFTERQPSRVREAGALHGLTGSVRILPFPYVPAHSLGELTDLEHRVWGASQRDESIRKVIVGVGVDERGNVVDVGAKRGHVRRLSGLLREQFGRDAPIRVHREEAPVEV
jgi:hypothetical protein